MTTQVIQMVNKLAKFGVSLDIDDRNTSDFIRVKTLKNDRVLDRIVISRKTGVVSDAVSQLYRRFITVRKSELEKIKH